MGTANMIFSARTVPSRPQWAHELTYMVQMHSLSGSYPKTSFAQVHKYYCNQTLPVRTRKVPVLYIQSGRSLYPHFICGW